MKSKQCNSNYDRENAIRYLKLEGVQTAKELIANGLSAIGYAFEDDDLRNGQTYIGVNMLNQLIKSLEIINDLEGLEQSKSALKDLNELGWDSFEHRWIDNWCCTKERLVLAINDYIAIHGETA
ncbi:TPA: hypothetical protein ACIFEI_002686 [Acinetobacter nosocomialis]